MRRSAGAIVSDWADGIRASVKETIQKVIGSCYGYKCPLTSIRIPNNTGNITNVVTAGKNSTEHHKRLARDFVELNDVAERLRNYSEPLSLDDGELIYHFNGRFHTSVGRYTVVRDDGTRDCPI